jgi:hypothetical protein
MAPDSLIRWGFMDPVFDRAGRDMPNPYLSEPLARRVAAAHPELMQQFEAALAADPAFAKDPQARLRWWYAHSPYEPPTTGRYPIVRVWDAAGVQFQAVTPPLTPGSARPLRSGRLRAAATGNLPLLT